MLFPMYSYNVALLVLYAWAVGVHAADYPLPPSMDPFYIPPSGYAGMPSGAILRYRKLSNVSASVTLSAAYQLLYRTKDSLGNPSAAITTVLIPPNANYSQHLSYQTAYDQADPDCAPSYGLQQGANVTTGVSEIQGSAQMFLARGIPVSTSDYEGEAAAFTAGPQSGWATLDSIRAVLASTSITGIQSTAQTVMFGYSGGSIATEWACEYQHSYAQELSKNIIGAALGGLPINLTSAMIANSGSSSAGLPFASLQGLANGYPGFSKCMEKALVPSMAAAFHGAHYECGYIATFAYQDVFSYFKNGMQFIYSSCWKHVVNKAGIMGKHATPKIPMYIYKGTADEIVPSIQQTDALIQSYCDSGATITYLRYINGTHGSTATAGSGGAFSFLFNLLGGGSAPEGCSVMNVTIPSS